MGSRRAADDVPWGHDDGDGRPAAAGRVPRRVADARPHRPERRERADRGHRRRGCPRLCAATGPGPPRQEQAGGSARLAGRDRPHLDAPRRARLCLEAGHDSAASQHRRWRSRRRPVRKWQARGRSHRYVGPRLRLGLVGRAPPRVSPHHRSLLLGKPHLRRRLAVRLHRRASRRELHPGSQQPPVLRGKWVLEKILGQPPAPPPADVPSIEPDIRGATTIRQQLDKHRSIATCTPSPRPVDSCRVGRCWWSTRRRCSRSTRPRTSCGSQSDRR